MSTIKILSDRRQTETKGLRALAAMAFSGLGIIYADLGTSPLYTMNGLWPASGPVPSTEDVVGGTSALFWALTLVPLVKYAIICLYFGTDEGEGGCFALFVGLFPPRTASDDDRELTQYSAKDERVLDSTPVDRAGSGLLRKSKWPLMAWALFGTALIIADGVLTPAVSVVSAVAGIAVARPNVTDSTVPISIAFLVVLFLVQRWGTRRISWFFSPVMLVWFLLLAGTGISNILAYPGIFRAVDPSRAIMFFVRTKNYDALGGVILGLTGAEAMFASLGQFNPSSIRMGFALVYVSVVLAYFGQGARLIRDGAEVLPSLFYLTIPGGVGGVLYWVLFVVAIGACLIASQTLITAVFSLSQQLINMNAAPHFRMKQTSSQNQGQVYFASINYALLIAVVAVVGGFQTGVGLSHAFGFSVATVFFVTDTFLFLSIPFVKDLAWIFAILYFVFYAFIDGLFWGATLKKVPEGAWFPLGLGGILTIALLFYTYFRLKEDKFDDFNKSKLSRIIFRSANLADLRSADEKRVTFEEPVAKPITSETVLNQLELVPSSSTAHAGREEEEDELPAQPDERLWLAIPEGHLELARIPTFAIFHKTSSTGRGVPAVFQTFLRRWPSLPRVVIFLSTRVVGLAHVEEEDRYLISKVRSLEGFYGVTVRLGFRDQLPNFVRDLLPRIIAMEAASNPVTAERHVKEIIEAGKNTTHILPNYVLESRLRGNEPWPVVRRWMIEQVYDRIRVMFPDERARGDGNENVIHVGVPAAI
ncbi:potassium transporter [Mrakia frigida]|uniref:potassium transporter n=1 Tax=Mrakia frigida TaxID=29902 RepID=UPI003FCC2485